MPAIKADTLEEAVWRVFHAVEAPKDEARITSRLIVVATITGSLSSRDSQQFMRYNRN